MKDEATQATSASGARWPGPTSSRRTSSRPKTSGAPPHLEGLAQAFSDEARAMNALLADRGASVVGGGAHPFMDPAASPMYAAIAPHDPDSLVQEEWLNSRGAIARFDRSALEIRVIDCHESPRQDLAVIAAAVEVIRALVDGHLPGGLEDRASTERLARTLWRVAADAEETVIDDPALLAAFAIDRDAPTANRLWRELVQRYPPGSEHQPALDVILDRGPLARRMMQRAGPTPQRSDLQGLLADMAACLAAGSALHP